MAEINVLDAVVGAVEGVPVITTSLGNPILLIWLYPQFKE